MNESEQKCSEVCNPAQRYIALTCDVEALPLRADSDHFEKLILGRFPNATVAVGVPRMLEIARKHQIKIIFYLDLMSYDAYGHDRMKALVDLIQEHQQEIQIHAHLDHLKDEWFAQRNLKRENLCNSLDETSAHCLCRYLIHLIEVLGIKTKVLSFRGGSYRISRDLLEALPDYGFTYVSNYAAGNSTHYLRQILPDTGSLDPYLPPFKWYNGLIELPVSYVKGKKTCFTDGLFESRKYKKHFKGFFAAGNTQGNLITFVMHSWCFLKLDKDTGYFLYTDEKKAEAFEQFCIYLKRKAIATVSIAEIDSLIKSGRIQTSKQIFNIDPQPKPRDFAQPRSGFSLTGISLWLQTRLKVR